MAHALLSVSQQLKDGSLTFDDFLRKGLVEYLDVNEENDDYDDECTLFAGEAASCQMKLSERGD